nr:MAG: ORF1 [TTV-like mini virus]
MPPYYYRRKRFYKRKWFPRTRRWLRPRRPRRIIRRWRRRNRVRRKYYYRRYKKKLKKIYITQWQPKIIHKCKIKGMLCLFEAGPGRLSNNWAEYMNSSVPLHWSGGGGWSIQQLTLGALFQENELMRNVWTRGNDSLPLCRYLGTKLTFYKTDCTDYVCHYTTCSPMLDTVYHHAGAQPSQLLKQKQKIIVPRRDRNPNKRPYKKKFIKPGDLFTNKWYFQHDIVNTPLFMLTTSACELDYYYISPHAVSHSISFYCLNSIIFQRNAYKQLITTGYSPKVNYYLYATRNGSDKPTNQELIFLGDPTVYYLGEPPTANTFKTYTQTREHWGNPFHPQIINADITVWVSTVQPNNVYDGMTESATWDTVKSKPVKNIAKLSTPLYITCRYTPNQDTGEGNKIYIVSTARETNFQEPTDDSLIFDGYPLWILCWGWLDWIKKLNTVHALDRGYQVVIKSKFISPQLDYYVLTDDRFLNGKSPFQNTDPPPDIEDQHDWYPQTRYQQMSLEEICMSGPGTSKPKTKSIQAHVKYTCFFKWGGCPANMETATNPATQPTYPLPDHFQKAYEIQDPGTHPEKYLYDFDEQKGLLKKTATDRITKDSKFEKLVLTDGTSHIRSKFNPPAKTTQTTYKEILQTLLETPPEKEEEQTLQQQLNQQREQQQLLKQRLYQLMSLNIK